MVNSELIINVMLLILMSLFKSFAPLAGKCHYRPHHFRMYFH